MRKRIVVFCAAVAFALLAPHSAGASESCNYAFPGTPGTHPPHSGYLLYRILPARMGAIWVVYL